MQLHLIKTQSFPLASALKNDPWKTKKQTKYYLFDWSSVGKTMETLIASSSCTALPVCQAAALMILQRSPLSLPCMATATLWWDDADQTEVRVAPSPSPHGEK